MQRNAESSWSNVMTKNVYKVKGITIDHFTSIFKAHTHHKYEHMYTWSQCKHTSTHTARVYKSLQRVL